MVKSFKKYLPVNNLIQPRKNYIAAFTERKEKKIVLFVTIEN